MTKIVVIDYDMGNLHSVCKALEKAGGDVKVSDEAKAIASADALILPGVGSFDPAIEHLQVRDLIYPIQQAVKSGKPFLGICLGLQILFEASEEGEKDGLAIIEGKVKRFQSEPNITIPHMGWNTLQIKHSNHPLWQNLPPSPYFYFVHSYYVSPVDSRVISAEVTHGTQTVTASIVQDNVMAVQFHPEKSAEAGLQMLSNFVNLKI